MHTAASHQNVAQRHRAHGKLDSSAKQIIVQLADSTNQPFMHGTKLVQQLIPAFLNALRDALTIPVVDVEL